MGNNARDGGGGITTIGSVIHCNGDLVDLPRDPVGLNMSCEGSVLFMQNSAQFRGEMLLIRSNMQQNDGTLNFTSNIATGGSYVWHNIASFVLTILFPFSTLPFPLNESGGGLTVLFSNWSSTVVTIIKNSAGGAVYSNESKPRYFNSDTMTLVFLPGEHTLNTSIVFQRFESLTFLGSLTSLPNITSMIACNTSAFILSNISKVMMKALAHIGVTMSS